MKLFGYYWETVSNATLEVVASGFIKSDSITPQQRESVEGFSERVLPLYAPDADTHGYVETETDIEGAYGRGERDFVQGGRLKNPYNPTTMPVAHRVWTTAVNECKAHNKRR